MKKFICILASLIMAHTSFASEGILQSMESRARDTSLDSSAQTVISQIVGGYSEDEIKAALNELSPQDKARLQVQAQIISNKMKSGKSVDASELFMRSQAGVQTASLAAGLVVGVGMFLFYAGLSLMIHVLNEK